VILTACATKKSKEPLLGASRPPSNRIENCTELKRILTLRDQGFSTLRGKANIKSIDYDIDVELALRDPLEARVEILGVLGVRVGLLVADAEWIRLYIPRENTLYRFPRAEFNKDTLRRERFLELLPLKIVPELFPSLLLERVSLDRAADYACRFNEKLNAYELRIVDDKPSGAGRFMWIDPTRFAPLRLWYFPRQLPSLTKLEEGDINSLRPLVEVEYESWTGEELATLASVLRIRHLSQKSSNIRFEWLRAEQWENAGAAAFSWQPPASAKVKDY
jgi:hypothetical protein